MRDRGVSAIAAVLVLFSLLGAGLVLAYMVAAGDANRVNHMASTQALYLAHAGIEYAMKRYVTNPPNDETVSNQSFGPGTFTVARGPLGFSDPTLIVAGTVSGVSGNAVRSYRIDNPTQGSCTSIYVDNVNVSSNPPSGTELGDIRFKKACLNSVTITTITFSWAPNSGELLNEIAIETSSVYNNPAGLASGLPADITDYTISDVAMDVMNFVKFDNHDIHNKAFTMTFTFSDLSTKTVTFNTN